MEEGHLPVGFAMSIAQHNDALKYYGSLDKSTQMQISDYIQDSVTGYEAKQRIDTSIEGLSKQNLNFLG